MESTSISKILKENNIDINKFKKVFSEQKTIPMLSIKNIIIGSTGTVVPWVILLILVALIILI
jgi:hypothetical protein